MTASAKATCGMWMPIKRTHCGRVPSQEDYDLLLEAQGHACGMCREPFTEGQQIFIDHDHNLGCHPDERHACDKCRRACSA
jgi:Recombination endonuclease VII